MESRAVPVEAEQEETRLQLVSFFLGTEEYALDILDVQEILRTRQATRVPGSPAFLQGVVNLRGRIVPVVDLRLRLGMPRAEQTEETRVIVVDPGEGAVGLCVDRMSEVLGIGASSVRPAPAELDAAAGREYVRGVAKLGDRLLILLDLDRLLAEHGA